MKFICGIAFVIIFSFVASAQDSFEYKGKTITAAQAKKLYDFAKTFLFMQRGGKIYDIRSKDGEIKKIKPGIAIGDTGLIQGRITSRIDKTTALVEIVFTRKAYEDEPLDYPGNHIIETVSTVTLLDAPESNNISVPVIRVKTQEGNEFSKNMTFAVLQPLPKFEFSEYIKKSYIYSYKVDYIPCPDCKGKGYIEKEPARGKMSGEREKCQRCNGAKKIKYKINKVPVEV